MLTVPILYFYINTSGSMAQTGGELAESIRAMDPGFYFCRFYRETLWRQQYHRLALD
jgi:hypothetical protein